MHNNVQWMMLSLGRTEHNYSLPLKHGMEKNSLWHAMHSVVGALLTWCTTEQNASQQCNKDAMSCTAPTLHHGWVVRNGLNWGIKALCSQGVWYHCACCSCDSCASAHATLAAQKLPWSPFGQARKEHRVTAVCRPAQEGLRRALLSLHSEWLEPFIG